MSVILKQSTASQEVVLGPFVDATDGFTAETGLTIANTDIKLHLTGATTLASKNSGGATHISGGVYYAVLDATDTATLGPLRIICHVSGARPIVVEAIVLAANVYDSLIAASDYLEVSNLLQTYEGSETVAALYKYMRAVLLGAVTGQPSSPAFKSADGNTTRVTATVDGSGNRSSVTLNSA